MSEPCGSQYLLNDPVAVLDCQTLDATSESALKTRFEASAALTLSRELTTSLKRMKGLNQVPNIGKLSVDPALGRVFVV